jgi:SPX domain protein involved in polyphosphate accumulation
MKVYLNSITGIDDAIISMYMSKRSWTREKEVDIRKLVETCTYRNGRTKQGLEDEVVNRFDSELLKIFKWGKKHITLLRYMDISVTVQGLHRGATDDFDSHAKRLDNRIVRSSTRLATYTTEEISEWYEDKIIPTDIALAYLGINTPEEIVYNNNIYVKSPNGYILKGMENLHDVRRGLYMLSLPMDFIFKVNVTEFAHIVKERDKNSSAAPELKLMIESLITQLEEWYPMLNRKLFYDIKN